MQHAFSGLRNHILEMGVPPLSPETIDGQCSPERNLDQDVTGMMASAGIAYDYRGDRSIKPTGYTLASPEM